MDSNLTQVEANPIGCWERMTPLQLQYFENRYYARIEKEAQRELRKVELEETKRRKRVAREWVRTHRALQKVAEKDQRKQDREVKRGEKTLRKITALFQRISTLHTYEITDEMIRYHGRSIGNDIHDLPVHWTGWESEQSISQHAKGYKHCNEHFWPRQYAGEQIVKHIIENNGIEFDDLFEMLLKFRRVHRVTSEENRRLMKFQSAYTFTDPNTSYNQAGIKLVKVN